MRKQIQFPVKGTYYYAADLALNEGLIHVNTPLQFIPEPNNAYDSYAIQIWLPLPSPLPATNTTQMQKQPQSGYLLGYVPKVMSRPVSKALHASLTQDLIVAHHAQLGRRIEIDCLVSVEQNLFPYLYLATLAYLTKQLYLARRTTTRLLNRLIKY